MSTESTASGAAEVQERISDSVFVGVLLALLGLFALFTPLLTGLALTVSLGAILVFGALLHVFSAFSAGSFWGVVWQIVLAIVYAAVGVAILANPVLGLATLTLLVIWFFVLSGITQLVWAVVGDGNRVWIALSGVVSLLLAGLLWVDFPTSALWAVGVLFGVELLSTGVAIALAGRRGAEPTPEGAPSAGTGP